MNFPPRKSYIIQERQFTKFSKVYIIMNMKLWKNKIIVLAKWRVKFAGYNKTWHLYRLWHLCRILAGGDKPKTKLVNDYHINIQQYISIHSHLIITLLSKIDSYKWAIYHHWKYKTRKVETPQRKGFFWMRGLKKYELYFDD